MAHWGQSLFPSPPILTPDAPSHQADAPLPSFHAPPEWHLHATLKKLISKLPDKSESAPADKSRPVTTGGKPDKNDADAVCEYYDRRDLHLQVCSILASSVGATK